MSLRAGLGIRSGETGIAGWVCVFFAVTQASHGLGINAADTLFFLRYGVDSLPQMILISGIAVMVFLIANTAGMARLGTLRWGSALLLGTAGWVFVERLLIGVESTLVYPVIWVSTQVVVWLTLTTMWNVAESVCDTRQAKRLFPLFASAGVAGGVVGNLATGALASLLGTENILVVQASLLVAAAAVVMRVRRLPARTSHAHEGRRAMRTILGLFRGSRLLQLAAVVSFVFSVLFFLVVFPFSEAVATAFPTEEEMAGYLGVFSSVATAATFVFSLVVTRRLFARLGLVISLMIVPIVYAAGFGVWLTAFGLTAAAIVRGSQWVAVNAIAGTAYPALFNFLPGERRGQASTLMTAVPGQLGTVAAGLILIAGSSLGSTARFSIGLVLAVAALFSVIAMRPAYLDAVVGAVRLGMVGVFNVPQRGLVTPENGEVRLAIESSLADERPEARAVAVTVLGRLDPSGSERVEPMLADPSPIVRIAAFDAICAIEPERVRDHATAALLDSEPAVRLQATRALGTRRDPVTIEKLLPLLDDPDIAVRVAAAGIVGGTTAEHVVRPLLDEGRPLIVALVLEEAAIHPRSFAIEPGTYLADQDRRVRAAAARALAARGGDLHRLAPLLEDRSPGVRRAAGGLLASSNAGREILQDVLETGSYTATETALRAMTPMPDPDNRYLQWAKTEALRAATLERYRLTLSEAYESTVGDYLVQVLGTRVKRLRSWVMLAVTTPGNRPVMEVIDRGVSSDDPNVRAGAIEALDMMGDRNVSRVLVPLLESEPGRGLEPDEVLGDLASDFDPWLRTLATRVRAEQARSGTMTITSLADEDLSDLDDNAVAGLASMAIEHIDALSVMDRVLALQRVPMFSSLDPEELELVARATSEAAYEPYEVIYVDGAEGDEMLVLVDGSVRVTKRRGDKVELIRTYEKGDHVGELALLGGGRRIADVVAGERGAYGIVLGRTEFRSIIEERPVVGVGMLETLAQRLADQTER